MSQIIEVVDGLDTNDTDKVWLVTLLADVYIKAPAELNKSQVEASLQLFLRSYYELSENTPLSMEDSHILEFLEIEEV